MTPAGDPPGGQEETAVELVAVGGDPVDLVRAVRALQLTVARPATGVATHDDYIALPDSPFALNPQQPRAEVEDEVVAPALEKWLVDADPELDRLVDDR